MPRTKVHSPKRKKRRFTGKQYMKKSSSATTESKESIKKSNKSSGDKDDAGRGVKHESVKSLPASVRKLKPQLDDSSEKALKMKALDLSTSQFLPWYSSICHALPANVESFLSRKMKHPKWVWLPFWF